MSTKTRIETRPFGRTGMNVSIIGFGAGQIGNQDVSQETADRLLNGMLDDGLNVIDTAECYGNAEELIGNAISRRRDDYYLFTKSGHGKPIGQPDWDPKVMAEMVDRSLQRLKVDHVDLIQLHTCEKEKLQQGDVIDVLRRAREAGKTRFIGYSGDSDDAEYAIECGAFDTLQISVSVADQESLDRGLPEKARAAGMGVLAKRSVANAAWREDPNKLQDIDPYQERLEKLDYPHLKEMELQDAVGYNLRFTLGAPGVDCALVGTRFYDHWRDNLKDVLKGPLPKDEFEAIRSRWREVCQVDWKGVG